MPSLRPTISLYIPAYNAADTLKPCLESVSRQSVQPDEVIVVDDGSKDNTAKIARQAGVRVIRHQRNRGVAAARNTAIRAAKGDFIASLDADLVARRDWLRTMLANFNGRRKIAGCCGRVIEKHTDTIADRWRAVHMKLNFGMRRSYTLRWLYCGISLIRRESFESVGLFDERCRWAYEDVDLSDRLRQADHALLYDPAGMAYHLKRSKPGNVIRGFWGYWAAKNEMQGAYKSLRTAAKLMVERQMGIASYRIAEDIRHRRDELLPLDLLIPTTFCVRDIENMVRLGTLKAAEARTLHHVLAQHSISACIEHLGMDDADSLIQLSFVDGRIPRSGPSKFLRSTAKSYLRTFSTSIVELVTSLRQQNRTRIVNNLSAVLTEAYGRLR